MKKFNASKVRALGNLQSRTEKQKAYARKLNGIMVRWSQDREPAQVKRVREFLAPVKQSFIPCKVRGRNGCRLSVAKREALHEKKILREAFFASL